MRVRIFNESCNVQKKKKKRKMRILHFPFSRLLSFVYAANENSLNLIRIYRVCGNFAVGKDRMFSVVCGFYIDFFFMYMRTFFLGGEKIDTRRNFFHFHEFFYLAWSSHKSLEKINKKNSFLMRKVAWRNFMNTVGNVTAFMTYKN